MTISTLLLPCPFWIWKFAEVPALLSISNTRSPDETSSSKVLDGWGAPIPILLLPESITSVLESKFNPLVTEAVAALKVKVSLAASPNVMVLAVTLKSCTWASKVPLTIRLPVNLPSPVTSKVYDGLDV